METRSTILKGAQVLLKGQFVKADVLITDSSITSISPAIDIPRGTVVIDCSSFFIIPGLVDLHVHLREPGFESKETILSGTSAAARGGFTTVCAMPNLNPAPDCPENLNTELNAIRSSARVKVLPYATITKGRRGEGEIVDMAALRDSIAGFSDDGCGVQEEEVMRSAMERAAELGAIITAHCEVNSLLRGGYIHDGDYCLAHGHKGICSESEWAEVERDCILAEETGCRLHICHVSTAESVEIIRRAKARGVKVTAETCPHYLVLTDADLQEDGRFKMNPPIRSARDRDALIEGLEDGTIDGIVTDHAPHTAEQKSKGLAGSAMGVVGLETSFPVMYTHFVKTGRWTLPFLIDKMSLAPRRIFNLNGLNGLNPEQNGITPGQTADLAVLDLNAHYVIDPAEFLSKGRSTPFEGMEVYGRTVYTIVEGKIVYSNEQGIL